MSGFTRDEMRMVRDKEFYPAKAEIIRKFNREFMGLRDLLRTECQKNFQQAGPAGCDFENGQLVKGERFQDFPYVYLDFPKYFSKDEMFTFRSFFWWGHALFFCWFLSGPSLDEYKKRVQECVAAISRQAVFISTADSPWEWSLEKPHAVFLDHTSEESLKIILKDLSFLKLGCSLSLDLLETEDAIPREGLRIFRLLKPIVR